MHVFPLILGLALALVVMPVSAQPTATDSELAERALEIAQRAMIVDTHVDVPYRLHEGWADVSEATAGGEFDYPRARRGGLDIPFMSIYTPASSEATGRAFQLANQLIDSVEAMVGRAPEKFVLVGSAAEAEAAWQAGRVGLAMGMENGAPLAGKLENLQFFHNRGIRYVTLTHSMSNHIADSSFSPARPWGGLSPFGREVVAEMNRLGIMIDISHVSDAAFYQALEVSTAPVIASHSSARHFTPGFERNMSDDMIRALAANGGVLQINFGSSFITPEAQQWMDEMRAARDAWVAEGGDADGPAGTAWQAEYRQQHGAFPFATLSDVVDHYDHVIGLVGHEYVGVGSDFDGVGDTLPEGLKDVSAFPALVEEFLRRGYPEEHIEAILGGNLVRVWREVESVAAPEQVRR